MLLSPLAILAFVLPALAAIECNVLDYGAVADNQTDIGPALTATWKNCVIPNVTTTVATDVVLLVPSGSFLLTSMVLFDKAKYWNLHLVGNLYLPFNTTLGGIGGTMLQWQNCNNILVDGPGAIFGNGYRIEITEITLYDAPMFHVTIFGNNNLAHNMMIRATHVGETDGFDMSGNNNYVHDVIVENGDECVTVKTPTNGFVAENIQCIHTAGCNIGSFGSNNTNVSVQNVYYRNVTLTDNSDAGVMIKSYPNNIGFVKNITYENFTFVGSSYPLYISAFWAGNGRDTGKLEISDVHYSGMQGTGSSRYPGVVADCNAGAHCTNITYSDISINGTKSDRFTNACGSGLPKIHAC
ncbi:unnamed protein product [Mycena citricolor]|uniref:Glycoside hydrolase family 28 protein n=1 Tax=Mycena citricolor TaxID=2018698 RepID=A0AAD2HVS5_9AGAR|nr:unnamed protein product [Mycena citricolor]CAK5281087.1 unnamed protein product [Mycena citricolor]